jgi:hypothetical protein
LSGAQTRYCPQTKRTGPRQSGCDLISEEKIARGKSKFVRDPDVLYEDNISDGLKKRVLNWS